MTGLCGWGFQGAMRGDLDLARQWAIAEEAGFDALDALLMPRLRAGEGAPEGPRLALTLPPLARYDILAPDAAASAAAEQRLAEAIEQAAAFGAWSLSSAFARCTVDPADRAALLGDVIARFAERYERLAERARASGIVLLAENVPHHWTADLDAVRALKSAAPSLSFCLDLGNTLIGASPPETWHSALGSILAKLHLSDGTPTEEGGLHAADPGEGRLGQEAGRLASGARVPVYCEPAPSSVAPGDEIAAARRWRTALDA